MSQPDDFTIKHAATDLDAATPQEKETNRSITSKSLNKARASIEGIALTLAELQNSAEALMLSLEDGASDLEDLGASEYLAQLELGITGLQESQLKQMQHAVQLHKTASVAHQTEMSKGWNSEGWLLKADWGKKSFKEKWDANPPTKLSKYYFTLEGNTLHWKKNPKDKKEVGQQSLEDVEVVRATTAPQIPSMSLDLVTPTNIFTLCPEDKEDRFKWTMAFNKIVTGVSSVSALHTASMVDKQKSEAEAKAMEDYKQKLKGPASLPGGAGKFDVCMDATGPPMGDAKVAEMISDALAHGDSLLFSFMSQKATGGQERYIFSTLDRNQFSVSQKKAQRVKLQQRYDKFRQQYNVMTPADVFKSALVDFMKEREKDYLAEMCLLEIAYASEARIMITRLQDAPSECVQVWLSALDLRLNLHVLIVPSFLHLVRMVCLLCGGVWDT